MGEERVPVFSKLRRARYTYHSGRESKKSWPKHGDILSQSRCSLAGWQGTGRCDCPAVGTSLPTEARAPSEHGEKVAFREGQRSSCKEQAPARVVGSLAEGWPLSIIPAWGRPSLSLHSCL